MPNKDGTGPEGKGSKTGRGLGKCNSEEPLEKNKSYGRGYGEGNGKGRKRRNFKNTVEKG